MQGSGFEPRTPQEENSSLTLLLLSVKTTNLMTIFFPIVIRTLSNSNLYQYVYIEGYITWVDFFFTFLLFI